MEDHQAKLASKAAKREARKQRKHNRHPSISSSTTPYRKRQHEAQEACRNLDQDQTCLAQSCSAATRKASSKFLIKCTNNAVRDVDCAAVGDCGTRTGNHTLSIAVAGSIINNVQSLEQATRLAGQIARAAAIFRVDEIVVFDDGPDSEVYFNRTSWANEIEEKTGGRFLARILGYLEVPQYLRRALFPMHSSLRFVGLLPPLDVPHHLRKHGWLPYREGITLDKEVESGSGCYVDVGLHKDVLIRQHMQPGIRVTVALGASRDVLDAKGAVFDVVSSAVPKEKEGLYWGYSVRHTFCLNAVFKECPFLGGYDYTIGTSEHGEKLRSSEFVIPKSRHVLVAFGGLAGLEECKELDETIEVDEVAHCFDRYINTCPYQGSRTIRTEEAILISLQYLHDPIICALEAAEAHV